MIDADRSARRAHAILDANAKRREAIADAWPDMAAPMLTAPGPEEAVAKDLLAALDELQATREELEALRTSRASDKTLAGVLAGLLADLGWKVEPPAADAPEAARAADTRIPVAEWRPTAADLASVIVAHDAMSDWPATRRVVAFFKDDTAVIKLGPRDDWPAVFGDWVKKRQASAGTGTKL